MVEKESERMNQIAAIGFLGKAIEKASNGKYEDALAAISEAKMIIKELSDICEYGIQEK